MQSLFEVFKYNQIYIGKSYAHLTNESPLLYPNITLYMPRMYISRLLVIKDNTHTNVSPHRRSKLWVHPGVQCASVLSLKELSLPRLHSIPLTTVLTYWRRKQAFLVTRLPQQVTSSVACLKGLLVIPHFITFYFDFVSFFYFLSFFFLLHKKTRGKIKPWKLKMLG